MASVVLSGDTSGSITVAAPAVAGSTTQTLVNVTGTLAPVVSGTAVASTSGTSIDFTSIPSWVKRITVMFSGVSTNGTSNLIIQLGTGSTTYTTTGYLGAASYIASASAASTQMSTGFMVNNNMAAADIFNGSVTLTLLTGNTWSETGVLGRQSSTLTSMSAGSIPLAAALTAVRITTVNGTDTFDAGTINILYE
jgi:hypothetical protein